MSAALLFPNTRYTLFLLRENDIYEMIDESKGSQRIRESNRIFASYKRNSFLFNEFLNFYSSILILFHSQRNSMIIKSTDNSIELLE